MRFLSDSDLLEIWETGYRRHPLDRALLILGTAFPDIPYESIADWPVGRRNRVLVELHCGFFGNRIHSWVACRQCGEKLEFEVDGQALTAELANEFSSAPIIVNGYSF